MFKNVISVTYEIASDTGIRHGALASALGLGLALGIGRASAWQFTKCLGIDKQTEIGTSNIYWLDPYNKSTVYMYMR